jgi:hypothetical protein
VWVPSDRAAGRRSEHAGRVWSPIPEARSALLDFHFARDAEFFDALAEGGAGDAEHFRGLHLVSVSFFQGPERVSLLTVDAVRGCVSVHRWLANCGSNIRARAIIRLRAKLRRDKRDERRVAAFQAATDPGPGPGVSLADSLYPWLRDAGLSGRRAL